MSQGSLITLLLYAACIFKTSTSRIVPLHYDLHLNIEPDSETLSGFVRCRVLVENKTEIIKMSADASVIVNNASIELHGKTNEPTTWRVKKIEKISPHWLHIYVDQKLFKNHTYNVRVHFESIKAKNENESFYILSPQKTNNTKTNSSFYVIDLTKNESKPVFPCFYHTTLENFKTSFNLTITRPRSYKVATISYAISSVLRNGSRYFDTYLPTTPISIHSFAVIASNGGDVYEVTKNGNIKCNNNTLRFKLNEETLVCMLDYLTEFYGVPMPCPSITLVVAPNSVNIHAKAYGLLAITDDILYAANPTCALMTLVYRLSLQWWNYVDGAHSNSTLIFSSFNWFVANDIFIKFLKKSDASEYENFVNVIGNTYYSIITEEWRPNKTAGYTYLRSRDTLALIMVRDILGRKLFTEGLATLLKSHRGLVKGDDIWRYLTNVAVKNDAFDFPDFPQSVEEIIKPFINRNLFAIPLLEFDLDFYGSFGGFIRQTPFAFSSTLYDSRMHQNTTGPLLWKIPIQLVSEHDKFIAQNKFVWTKTRNRAIALTNFSQKEILLLNPEIRGPFLVNYRKNNWDSIFNRFDSIPIKFRTQLLYDVHVLAHSFHYNYTDYIRHVSKLSATKDNLPVWKNYINLIKDVDRRLSGTAQELARTMFTKKLLTIYKTYLNPIDEKTPFWIKEMRSTVESFLCSHSVPVCDPKHDYEMILNNLNSSNNAIIQNSHTCAVIKNQNLDMWLRLKKLVLRNYRNYSSCNRKNALKLLTGCTENKAALLTFLSKIFKNSTYFSINFEDDLHIILNNLKSTNAGSSVLFNFVVTEFNDLKLNFPSQINMILEETMKNLKTETEIHHAIDFLKSKANKFDDVNVNVDELRQKLEEEQYWFLHVVKETEKLLIKMREEQPNLFQISD